MTLKSFCSRSILVVLLLSLLLSFTPSPRATKIANSLPKYIDEFNVPTPQSAPLAITVDRNGIVWFTESNVSKLGRFDPSNQTFREYQVPGVGDMWGIASDQEGRIWMSQYAGRGSVNPGGAIVAGGSGRLLVFDTAKDGFSIVDIPTNSSFPMRLTIDHQDRVWFTEFLGNKIGMYDQTMGRLSEYRIPTNESGPADLTFSNNGQLWFTEAYAQSVGEFFPNNQSFIEYHVGQQTPSMIVSSPVGIAVDAEGKVWVGDHGGNWIVEFNPVTGQVARYATHTPPEQIYPLSIPNGLLIDEKSRVWFAEHGGNSIGYFDSSNKTMVEYSIPSGPIATTLWIALAPNGAIWFTEWSADKIGVVHTNLQTPFSIGLNVNSLVMGAGQQLSVDATANISQPNQGNGTWASSWSSYNPTDTSVAFTPSYPSLNGTTAFTVARIALSNSVSPGNYSLSIGIDDANIRVWALVPVEVLPTPQSSPNANYVSLAEIILLSSALIIVFLIRRRRLR